MAQTVRKDDCIIAVMGPTGSGKSSFIKSVTLREDVEVGHGLGSMTKHIQSYSFVHDNVRYTLVDSPGFDDSDGIDNEIVTNILAWLKGMTEQDTKLNGLIYFHRIIDPRITGSARSNIRLFQRLCGNDNMANVVLGTTFWDQVQASLGERREAMLKSDAKFWQLMVQKGSRTVRLQNRRVENLRVIKDIARSSPKIVLEAQKEMLAGKKLEETAAAQGAQLDIAELIAEFDKKLKLERLHVQREKDKKEAEAKSAAEALRKELEQKKKLEKQRQEKEKRAREEKERQKLAEREKLEAKERAEAQRAEWGIEVLQGMIAQQQRDQQIREQWARQWAIWNSYVCRCYSNKRYLCNRCGWRLDLRGPVCYHCCFCDGDTFFTCQGCGSFCRDPSHPPMKGRRVDQTLIGTLLR